MPNKTVEQNLTTNCDLNVTRETQANDILILKNNSSTLEILINCNSDNSLKSIQNEKKFEITENFYSTFDLILKFNTKEDLFTLGKINKKFNTISRKQIELTINNTISTYSNKLKNLTDKYNLSELTKDIPSFFLTRGTIKAIELLNESIYVKLFLQTSPPSEDILFPFKILFQFLKSPILKTLPNDNEFWLECCNILSSQGKTGDFINNSVKNFDFSDENIYVISKLCDQKEKKIAPSYFSKICGTTGLVIFMIRDALEYTGIIIDKKTLPSRLYRLYKYGLEKNQKDLEKIKNFNQFTFKSDVRKESNENSNIPFILNEEIKIYENLPVENKSPIKFPEKIKNDFKVEIGYTKDEVSIEKNNQSTQIQLDDSAIQMMNQSSKKNEEIFKISEEKIVKNVKKIEEFQKEIPAENQTNTVLKTATPGAGLKQNIKNSRIKEKSPRFSTLENEIPKDVNNIVNIKKQHKSIIIDPKKSNLNTIQQINRKIYINLDLKTDYEEKNNKGDLKKK